MDESSDTTYLPDAAAGVGEIEEVFDTASSVLVPVLGLWVRKL